MAPPVGRICRLTGVAVLLAVSQVPASAPASHVTQAVRDRLPAAVRSASVLRVGSQQTFPPIEFHDDRTSRLAGLSVDLLTEVGRRLGLRVEYIHAEYASLISGIQANRFDIASGGISDTEEREKTLDFVDYLNSGVSMLLKKSNPARVETIDDMCGKTAATLLGSRVIVGAVDAASARCVSRAKPAIRVDQFPATPDARLQLHLGRVDAYLADFPALVYLVSRFPDEYRIAGGNYVIVRYILSWGVAKGSDGLRDAIQAAAQDAVADGSYQRILNKWNNGAAALPEITVNLPASKR